MRPSEQRAQRRVVVVGTQELADAGEPRRPRFTAVVDARGDRGRRAWFAERHEPAHLLVPDDAARAAWRRTNGDRPEPVERVIDAIAARLGFWEPIVRPALERALREEPNILRAFERTHAELAPEASLGASFRAFANLVAAPIVLLWCEQSSRAADARSGKPEASMALRAQVVITNQAAVSSGVYIPENYRVPIEGSIAQAYAARGAWTYRGDDNLGRWRSSRGTALPARQVRITARGRWSVLEVTD